MNVSHSIIDRDSEMGVLLSSSIYLQMVYIHIMLAIYKPVGDGSETQR